MSDIDQLIETNDVFQNQSRGYIWLKYAVSKKILIN